MLTLKHQNLLRNEACNNENWSIYQKYTFTLHEGVYLPVRVLHDMVNNTVNSSDLRCESVTYVVIMPCSYVHNCTCHLLLAMCQATIVNQ